MAKNVNAGATELEGNGTFDLSGGSAGVGSGMDEGGMVFNLTDVEEERKFEIMPKGTYSAIVDSFEFGASSKGNPMITAVYSITDPEFENRKLYDFMVLAGDGKDFGLAKIKKFLIRVCPDVSLATFNPKALSDSGDAVGRECRITIGIQTQKQGEYKGEKRNTVKDILAPDNAGTFL
jgi:hypothetical protein